MSLPAGLGSFASTNDSSAVAYGFEKQASSAVASGSARASSSFFASATNGPFASTQATSDVASGAAKASSIASATTKRPFASTKASSAVVKDPAVVPTKKTRKNKRKTVQMRASIKHGGVTKPLHVHKKAATVLRAAQGRYGDAQSEVSGFQMLIKRRDNEELNNGLTEFAQVTKESKHLSFVDENDEYQSTISNVVKKLGHCNGCFGKLKHMLPLASDENLFPSMKATMKGKTDYGKGSKAEAMINYITKFPDAVVITDGGYLGPESVIAFMHPNMVRNSKRACSMSSLVMLRKFNPRQHPDCAQDGCTKAVSPLTFCKEHTPKVSSLLCFLFI